MEAALKEAVDPSTLSNEDVEKIVYFAILSPVTIDYISELGL